MQFDRGIIFTPHQDGGWIKINLNNTKAERIKQLPFTLPKPPPILRAKSKLPLTQREAEIMKRAKKPNNPKGEKQNEN